MLEKSLRVALARKDREIGDEHILLALTMTGGVVAEALADHGVTYASVEAAVAVLDGPLTHHAGLRGGRPGTPGPRRWS